MYANIASRYYRIIHPVLPLLPTTKSALVSAVAAAPPTLRDAFKMALDCAIRYNPASHLFFDVAARPSPYDAAATITAYELEDSSNLPLSVHLLYIQTVVLMSLRRSCYVGPSGLNEIDWIARALGLANSLKLFAIDDRQELRQP